jgi:polysaccharide export outer membrane protein
MRKKIRFTIEILLTLVLSAAGATPAAAQTASPSAPQTPPRATATAPAPPSVQGVAVSSDYVIGAEDVIAVLFWREQEMSGDVTVRPDGMITLPLIGDVKAAGLTPEVLGTEVQKAAARYLTDPNVTVTVRQINSRKVFITGMVAQPNAYPLTGPRTVMQLIALAGGLAEYADAEHISIMRTLDGRTQTLKFNYKDVSKGKNLGQNILLQPGDTVVVP